MWDKIKGKCPTILSRKKTKMDLSRTEGAIRKEVMAYSF